MPKKKSTKIKKSKHTSSPNVLYRVIGFLLLIGLGYMIYSVVTFQGSDQEKEGFFACNPDGTICELSQHIHAHIDMNVCGKQIVFEKEKGRTDEQHTHKEKNLMHWHARLQVDPQTREPLDPTRRQIRAFLQQMEYALLSRCPNNASPVLTVLVNGKESSDRLDYVWRDGDTIEISFN